MPDTQVGSSERCECKSGAQKGGLSSKSSPVKLVQNPRKNASNEKEKSSQSRGLSETFVWEHRICVHREDS